MTRCLLFVLSCLLAGLPGCAEKKTNAAPGAGRPAAQVVVAEARRQAVAETLSLIGNLLANEMIEVRSETEGVIQEINFQEGQPVQKGDLLVRLDETKFTAALAEAEANFKLSEANFARARQLLGDNLISQQEFEQLAATFEVSRAAIELRRRELKDTRIYASFGGIVGARQISPGQVIGRNDILTWLVDADPVKVEVNVPERFLGQVQLGQKIELSVAALPDRKFTGDVYFIAPAVDAATRTVLVKARIPNPGHELKPGMFAHLELTLAVRESAVVIPESALNRVMDDSRANVFEVGADDTVQLKQVTLGVRLAGKVEILSGLQGGEKVVIEGLQKISPGAKVQYPATQ